MYCNILVGFIYKKKNKKLPVKATAKSKYLENKTDRDRDTGIALDL